MDATFSWFAFWKLIEISRALDDNFLTPPGKVFTFSKLTPWLQVWEPYLKCLQLQIQDSSEHA